MQRVEAVVFRRSHHENTVAIVGCDSTDTIRTSADLHHALRRAITDWVDRTTDGKAVYAENRCDFNLGDLAQWDDDPTLLSFVRLHGIVGFKITCHCDADPARGWTYDDNLVNDPEH